MKKASLFKTLADILYFLHFIGLIGIVLIIPFGIVNINQVDMRVQDWTIFYWLILVIILITYIIFLRGLYYLRRMAKLLLSNIYFSEQISTNMRKSGIHFLLTGIISIIPVALLWTNKLIGGEISLTIDNNLMIPFFLMIIGLFFIIQSDALFLAKNLKEESDLTV